MTEIEIISVLTKAKPINATDNEMVLKAHSAAVKKAESLIKLSADPYLMSLLVDRYIHGHTFKQIALDRDIGLSTAHRFHGIAIERIKDEKNTRRSRTEGKG